jgi:hypothetical protein
MISFKDINQVFLDNNISLNGAFHIGAHNCEEMDLYNNLGIEDKNVIWIDAIPSKVDEAKRRGIPNVYNALISDKDDEEIIFNITNNIASSSILELGTHAQEHPHIMYVDKLKQNSITVDTFFKRNNIDASKYDFWNLDIQGAELMALKGAINSIRYAKAMYLEVNEKELYKNCGLIGEIDSFLADYNFKRVLTYMTQYSWGDALYIKE